MVWRRRSSSSIIILLFPVAVHYRHVPGCPRRHVCTQRTSLMRQFRYDGKTTTARNRCNPNRVAHQPRLVPFGGRSSDVRTVRFEFVPDNRALSLDRATPRGRSTDGYHEILGKRLCVRFYSDGQRFRRGLRSFRRTIRRRRKSRKRRFDPFSAFGHPI